MLYKFQNDWKKIQNDCWQSADTKCVNKKELNENGLYLITAKIVYIAMQNTEG